MKTIFVLISLWIIGFPLCAQEKNQLLTKSWICEDVVGADFNKIEDSIEVRCKKDPTIETKEFNETWKFLAELQDHLKMNKKFPAKWAFYNDGTLTAIKVWNNYYEGHRVVENLNWEIKNDLLYLTGVNYDQKEINFTLKIEKLEKTTLILSKKFLDWTIKILYTSNEVK
jgi:hypothetical protein